jgi:hypothetical protein
VNQQTYPHGLTQLLLGYQKESKHLGEPMSETPPAEETVETGTQSAFETAPNVDGHEPDPDVTDDPSSETPPGQSDASAEPTD